jgi:hypothetical protein
LFGCVNEIEVDHVSAWTNAVMNAGDDHVTRDEKSAWWCELDEYQVVQV